MLRKLVDYKKLNHELAALLIESYPDGYGDDDIIIFKNAHGEIIEAVEVKTKDTVYLVKISKSLSDFIANFEENIEKQFESVDQKSVENVAAQDAGQEFNSDAEESDLD